jgi:hypothetical protein
MNRATCTTSTSIGPMLTHEEMKRQKGGVYRTTDSEGLPTGRFRFIPVAGGVVVFRPASVSGDAAAGEIFVDDHDADWDGHTFVRVPDVINVTLT